MAVVREGLERVVADPAGTAHGTVYMESVGIAGKTGTAEYGKKGEGRKYGWMIAFAPFDEPRYAAALVIDRAVSGGVTAAPRMGELMRGLFSGAEQTKGSG